MSFSAFRICCISWKGYVKKNCLVLKYTFTLQPFWFYQRESSNEQGQEGTSSNAGSVSACTVPCFQKVLMNFLDNYAPVVGEFTCISACFNIYYDSLKIFRRLWLVLIPRLLNFLDNQRALPIILKMHAICFWSDGMIIIKCRRAGRRIRPCNGLLQFTIANLVFRHLRGSLAGLAWVNSKKGRKSSRLSVDEVAELLTKTNAR